jgi:hypothetical protein
MIRRNYAILLLVFLLAGISACKEDDRNRIAVEKVINEEVSRKVNDYIQMRMKRCIEKATKEANEIADSLLILEARLSRDTASKPPRPYKPEKPEIKALQDSSPIAPIFKRDTSGG